MLGAKGKAGVKVSSKIIRSQVSVTPRGDRGLIREFLDGEKKKAVRYEFLHLIFEWVPREAMVGPQCQVPRCIDALCASVRCCPARTMSLEAEEGLGQKLRRSLCWCTSPAWLCCEAGGWPTVPVV